MLLTSVLITATKNPGVSGHNCTFCIDGTKPSLYTLPCGMPAPAWADSPQPAMAHKEKLTITSLIAVQGPQMILKAGQKIEQVGPGDFNTLLYSQYPTLLFGLGFRV